MQTTVVIAILIGVLVVTLIRQRKARRASLIVAPRFATLAPQGPVPARDQLPGTMFVCMAGQLAFRAW
jgi:hypothetical protein